jgi:hypothetical protein
LKVEKAGYAEMIKQREKEIMIATEKYESAKQEYLKERTKLRQKLEVTENELMESKK